MLLYTTIITIFTIAFASQSLMTIKITKKDSSVDDRYSISVDYYYTNLIITANGETENINIIESDPESKAMSWILIFGIIVFFMFGCIMISLFLKYKKLYKFFSIIMLISLISIVISLNSDIYPAISNFKTLINETALIRERVGVPSDFNTTYKTTSTPGYIITIMTLIFIILAVISSFFIL